MSSQGQEHVVAAFDPLAEARVNAAYDTISDGLDGTLSLQARSEVLMLLLRKKEEPELQDLWFMKILIVNLFHLIQKSGTLKKQDVDLAWDHALTNGRI